MATTPYAAALTTAYRRARTAHSNGLASAGRTAWAQTITPTGDFDAQFQDWADEMLPQLHAAQAGIVTLTAGYVAAFLSAELDEEVAPVGLDPADFTTEALRGVPALDVYRRSLTTVRAALADDVDPEEAIARGGFRIGQTLGTDLILAGRAAMTAAGNQDDRVDGYTRVTDGVCCAVCAELDGEHLSTDDEMAIHPDCECTAEPVVDNGQPQLDTPDPEVDDSAGLTQDADHGDLDTTVHQHGELGAVVYPAGDNFAGV